MTHAEGNGHEGQGAPAPANQSMLERVIKLENELSSVSRSVNTPLRKDRRFWLGAAALPGILLIGNAIDSLFSTPFRSAMHSVLGTPQAVSDALGSNNAFRSDMAQSLATDIALGKGPLFEALVGLLEDEDYKDSLLQLLAEEISPGEESIQIALKGAMETDFVLRDDLGQSIDAAVGRRTNLLHADILDVGLTNSDFIDFGVVDETEGSTGCKYASAEDLFYETTDDPDAVRKEVIDAWGKCRIGYPEEAQSLGASYFIANAGQKVDISIGIRLWRIDMHSFAESGVDYVSEIPRGEILQHVSMTLEGKEVNPFQYQGVSIDAQYHTNAGPDFIFFKSLGNQLDATSGRQAFPLRTLNIGLTEKNLLASIILIISRS